MAYIDTVVPVMNGHPRNQAKVSVHCRWPQIRGNLTLKCVGRGIDNMAAQGRWPLTTGVAQGRYYCRWNMNDTICGFQLKGNASMGSSMSIISWPSIHTHTHT